MSTTLGDFLFKDIEKNEYLNELYPQLLQCYARKLLDMSSSNVLSAKNINASLRFADLLSKSTDAKRAPHHKMWAQEIITILLFLYPENQRILYYAGSVLENCGNSIGKHLIESPFQEPTLPEQVYAIAKRTLLTVPAENDKVFLAQQKEIYDKMESDAFSYAAPTSLGKSFVMQMYIKAQLQHDEKLNFALIVPSKALITEVRHQTIQNLQDLLKEKNYSIVTSSTDPTLAENKNFILIMTPERLVYLLDQRPYFHIDYLFIDEAHKLTGKNSRAPFYYAAISTLAKRPQNEQPHFIFSSPSIPNPEIYLSLLEGATKGQKNALSYDYSPVSQFKFLLDNESGSVSVYNEHAKKLIPIPDDSMAFFAPVETFQWPFYLGKMAREGHSLFYFSSTKKAIQSAILYAEGLRNLNNPELDALAEKIKNTVHPNYYLAQLIPKGVAYHVGYLPSFIRQNIERLFKKKILRALFCTSTITEGINLPADNLFISSRRNGRVTLSDIEFRNLIGRVGRVKYNLFGNIFFVVDRPDKQSEYLSILETPIEKKRLAMDENVPPKKKAQVVRALLEGESGIVKLKDATLQKYSRLLLGELLENQKSTIWRDFSPFLTDDAIEQIRKKNMDNHPFSTGDMSVSGAQIRHLLSDIRKKHLHYPHIQGSEFDYGEVRTFLENLRTAFQWDIYDKALANSGRLKAYIYPLKRWMEGKGLYYILLKDIEYYADPPKRIYIDSKHRPIFDGSIEHKNYVIANTLKTLEQDIQFKLANYFLHFSTAYRSIYGEHALDDNDWYEFVEFGTTNPLEIFLQKNGFSPEAASFIKGNASSFVTQAGDKYLVSRSLETCGNDDVESECKMVLYNRPDLFD